MTKNDLLKALNKIQLLLNFSESGLVLVQNSGDVSDRMIVCDAVVKLLGRRMAKDEKAKLKSDEREYELWCYTRLYEAVEDFEDVCSNIILNPELLKEYPPLFGRVFTGIGRIKNEYLDGPPQLEQVASIVVLCEKYLSEEELENLLGVFLIEEQCFDVLAKIPRLSKYFDEVPQDPTVDAMYLNLLKGYGNNGGVN